MNQNERIVFLYGSNGYFKTDFADLKKGDVFVMFEPNYTPVVYNDSPLLIALSDPYANNRGTLEIEMKDHSPLVLH